MPDLARKINFVPSSQTLVSSSNTPQSQLCLKPLLPDDAGFIYVDKNRSYVQYSFKMGGTSMEAKNAALAHYKEEDVKDRVTDVVAALLHLDANGNRLPYDLIIDIDGSSTLTCRRHKPGKAARHWEWTKDDQPLEMSGIKLRFEFALVREEREHASFAT